MLDPPDQLNRTGANVMLLKPDLRLQDHKSLRHVRMDLVMHPEMMYIEQGIVVSSCIPQQWYVHFLFYRDPINWTSAQIIMGVGVTYAAVPLYRMFCAATGFAGTPKVGMGKFEAERLVPVDDAKRIKVHFNADTSDALPWSFIPQQRHVSVLPGETSLAFYKAKNTSKQDIIGIATYNVTPDRVRLTHPSTLCTTDL